MSSASEDGHDPRSIANLLLDEADALGFEITNLTLQKFLYFAHGYSLVQYGKPLVLGFFEAWRYGPVHPVAYDAFRTAGRSPIAFRGHSVDALTGAPKPLPGVQDRRAHRLVRRVLDAYGEVPTSVLLDVVHAKGGPWDHIVEKSKTSVVLGMRIPNDVIAERFGRHLVGVGKTRDVEHEVSQFEPYGTGVGRGPSD